MFGFYIKNTDTDQSGRSYFHKRWKHKTMSELISNYKFIYIIRWKFDEYISTLIHAILKLPLMIRNFYNSLTSRSFIDIGLLYVLKQK